MNAQLAKTAGPARPATRHRRPLREAVWSFCQSMGISMMARQGHCSLDRYTGE
jgi:hypothetical protein